MNLRAWSAFVFLCVIWGTPYFFIKIAVQEVSPAWVAFGRIALGAIVLLPIAAKRGVLAAVWKHKVAAAAFAITELAIPFVAIGFAERRLSSSLAGILIAATPMVVILIAPLFGVRERLTVPRVAGLVIGFAGVVTLLGIGAVSGWQDGFAVLLLAIASLGYAAGPLIVERYLHGIDELGAAAVSLGIASVMLLPIALATLPVAMPSAQTFGAIAALGVLCTALAMWLYFYVIAEAGASRATIVAYVNPAVAAVLGVMVLHEDFGLNSGIGLALILFGSWLATREDKLPFDLLSRDQPRA